MTARDFFEVVREAVRDFAKAELELAGLEERRLSLGGHGTMAVSGGGSDVNGTSASVAYLDREAALRRRVEEDRSLIRFANEVVDGIDLGIGSRFADVVWHRACSDETWPRVAESTKLSQSTCLRYYAAAMDYCDSVGFDFVREGPEV